jgi:hypothetical protein
LSASSSRRVPAFAGNNVPAGESEPTWLESAHHSVPAVYLKSLYRRCPFGTSRTVWEGGRPARQRLNVCPATDPLHIIAPSTSARSCTLEPNVASMSTIAARKQPSRCAYRPQRALRPIQHQRCVPLSVLAAVHRARWSMGSTMVRTAHR